MVTLRSERMWEFLDRLITLRAPARARLQGRLAPRRFDGKGNYTLGLRSRSSSPRSTTTRSTSIKGMNISFVTTAQTDEEGRALLAELGMPFRAA